MEEKKFNKRIVFSVVAVILLIAVVAGATYAYFSAGASSTAQTVTTATMDLAFDDSTPIVNATNITPMRQADIQTKAAKKSFTVINNGTQPMYLQMKLTDVDMDPQLKDLWFRWALYEEGTRIGIGTFDEAGTEVFMQQNMVLEAGASNAKNYDLYIWIEESDENQNAMQGKSFSGKITVNGSMARYEDIALIWTSSVESGEEIEEDLYYDTNISTVTTPYISSEYAAGAFFNDNLKMFTNLSTITFEGDFYLPEVRRIPISVTGISGGIDIYCWDTSLKHLTNLTSFGGYIEEGFELPSSVITVNIDAETNDWVGTYDFSNLVNLESFSVNDYYYDEYEEEKTTIILPKSIENSVEIIIDFDEGTEENLENIEFVYQ